MCRPPPTNESGITVLAKPIALSVNIFGTLLLLPFVLGLIPLLLVVVALSTVFDGVHCLLCAPEPVVDLGGDGADRARGGPVLVFPGTCNGVFFQFGMTQYLAERYDLRGARVVGVSSGALCAASATSWTRERGARQQMARPREATATSAGSRRGWASGPHWSRGERLRVVLFTQRWRGIAKSGGVCSAPSLLRRR